MFTEQPFYGNYFTLDAHINTVISHWLVAYSSQWSTLLSFFFLACLSSLFDPITLILVHYLFERSLPPTFCEGRCIIFAFWWFSTSFADDKDSPLKQNKNLSNPKKKENGTVAAKKKKLPQEDKSSATTQTAKKKKREKKGATIMLRLTMWKTKKRKESRRKIKKKRREKQRRKGKKTKNSNSIGWQPRWKDVKWKHGWKVWQWINPPALPNSVFKLF